MFTARYGLDIRFNLSLHRAKKKEQFSLAQCGRSMKLKEITVTLYSQPSRLPRAKETHILYVPFMLLSLVLGIVWFEFRPVHPQPQKRIFVVPQSIRAHTSLRPATIPPPTTSAAQVQVSF